MKTIWIPRKTWTALALLAVAATARAETLSGHIMPFKCRNDDRKSHTRDCALRHECRATGFGLVLADGKFVRFDEKSNAMVEKLLQETRKTDDLQAEAEGMRTATDAFQLKSIRLNP